MNFKDIYNKKKKLDEASTSAEGGINVSGDIQTFIGKSGQEIDGLFAGGFHPDFGELKILLQNQLDDRYAKVDFTDINTPYLKSEFETIDLDMYTFDEPSGKDRSNFINDSDTNWKVVGVEYKFDEPSGKDKSNYLNDSENNWKTVDLDMYTFDEPVGKDRSNFINKSKYNWSLIK